ncbi:hypothetical protein D3C85_1088070 [compost metagenome]
MDRYRGAGKITEAIQVVLAAIDLYRARFHQCRAQCIGAACRFAPARAQGDIVQATALERVGTAFDSENGSIGVGQDNQAFLALARLEIVDLGCRRIEQQAIAGQQHIEAGG